MIHKACMSLCSLSSFGATENTGTGNYVGYVDVVKNESNDFCE